MKKEDLIERREKFSEFFENWVALFWNELTFLFIVVYLILLGVWVYLGFASELRDMINTACCILVIHQGIGVLGCVVGSILYFFLVYMADIE